MKKTSLMLFAALLLPAVLFAQSPSARSATRTGEYLIDRALKQKAAEIARAHSASCINRTCFSTLPEALAYCQGISESMPQNNVKVPYAAAEEINETLGRCREALDTASAAKSQQCVPPSKLQSAKEKGKGFWGCYMFSYESMAKGYMTLTEQGGCAEGYKCLYELAKKGVKNMSENYCAAYEAQAQGYIKLTEQGGIAQGYIELAKMIGNFFKDIFAAHTEACSHMGGVPLDEATQPEQ